MDVAQRRAELLLELAKLADEQGRLFRELAALDAPRPATKDKPPPRLRGVKRVVEPPAPPPLSKDPAVVGLAEERATRALRRRGIPLEE